MTDQQTITEFIIERLAEDEAAARAALPAEHECFHNETRKWWASGDRVRVVSRCGCPTIENADDAERARVARRTLREVAAKRHVLERHCADTPPYDEYCQECEPNTSTTDVSTASIRACGAASEHKSPTLPPPILGTAGLTCAQTATHG